MKGLREGILLCLECERMMRSRWVGGETEVVKEGRERRGREES